MQGSGVGRRSKRFVGPCVTPPPPLPTPSATRSPMVVTGWVDFGDIAALVLARSVSHRRRSGVLSKVASALTADEEHTTLAALGLSQRNPFWSVDESRSMDKVRALHAAVGAVGEGKAGVVW